MGDGRSPVKAALLLHLLYDMLQGLFLIFVQMQLLQNQAVALRQLGRRETDRDSRLLRVILDKMHDRMQAAVHGSAVVIGVAVVHFLGTFLVPRHMEGVGHQLVDALVLRRGNGDYRNSQHLLHLVDADGAAVFPDLVHHIQGQHHGNIQLHKLHGQIQVPLDIRGVHDIDDALRVLVQDEIPRHDLLAGVGRHGIDARQVCHQRILPAPDLAVFTVHRHAREISHMLAGSGELVEQRRLSAVLVARQGEGQHRALRQGMLRLLQMKFSSLAKARMGHRRPRLFLRRALGVPDVFYLYLLRVRQAQGQLVAVDAQLHRVTHGRVFPHGHVACGNQSHIEEVLPQGSFPAHRDNGRRLSDW